MIQKGGRGMCLGNLCSAGLFHSIGFVDGLLLLKWLEKKQMRKNGFYTRKTRERDEIDTYVN